MPWHYGAYVHHGNSAGKTGAGTRWDTGGRIAIVSKDKGEDQGCQKGLLKRGSSSSSFCRYMNV